MQHQATILSAAIELTHCAHHSMQHTSERHLHNVTAPINWQIKSNIRIPHSTTYAAMFLSKIQETFKIKLS